MKLVIDTDPGIDDAIAIALARALDDIDLLGVTTVFGNTYVEQSSRNARYLLDLLKWDVPVHEGAALPYGAKSFDSTSYVHGDEGFGGILDIPQVGSNAKQPAAAFLVEAASRHPGELVVCAVAPLTNIADAVALDPAFPGNVKRLVIMGGALDCPGNVSPYAEANIRKDAKAADVVFAAGFDMTMTGLDVTRQTLLTEAHVADLRTRSPVAGGFIAEITPFYMDYYRRAAGIDGCLMHDAAAILACTGWEGFGFVRTGIRVATEGENVGQTIRDADRREVDVAVEIDGEGAISALLDSLSTLD